MKLILEYSRFLAEYKPINLYVKGQEPIFIDVDKSRQKDILIRDILNEIYPGLRGDVSLNINGLTISGELLKKSQKNIAILYEIIDISKSIGEPIITADDLINFIKDNKYDLFSVNGKFFNRIYNRLGGATEKGKSKESESNDLFTRYAKSNGIDIKLKAPDSYKQDIEGIDSYFEHGGNKYTIQTKTLSSIIEVDDYYKVYISGYFTKIKTHYLVLIPINLFTKKYIFKGKNITTQIDENGVDYYYIPKADLLYIED